MALIIFHASLYAHFKLAARAATTLPSRFSVSALSLLSLSLSCARALLPHSHRQRFPLANVFIFFIIFYFF